MQKEIPIVSAKVRVIAIALTVPGDSIVSKSRDAIKEISRKRTKNMRSSKVLLWDRDSQDFRLSVWALQSTGYDVVAASKDEIAIEALGKSRFDVVIVNLPEDNAASVVLNKIGESNPEARIIALIENYNITLAGKAFRCGVEDCLFKPYDLTELWVRVVRVLEVHQKDSQPEASSESINEHLLNAMAIMSHDVRGNLVSMAAALKLLKRGVYGKMDETVGNELNRLYSRMIKLIGISEEFLGEALSIRDGCEVGREVLDLKQDIVDPVLSELSEEIRDHRVTVHNQLDVSVEKPLFIKGSKIWLKVVFRNLLKNAIKYGGKGCRIATDFRYKNQQCHVSVYNSGKPVPEEIRNKLFTPQLKNSGNGNRDGMGIGLYLIREVIKKHGGNIWYEARKDGSNFSFTLPVT